MRVPKGSQGVRNSHMRVPEGFVGVRNPHMPVPDPMRNEVCTFRILIHVCGTYLCVFHIGIGECGTGVRGFYSGVWEYIEPSICRFHTDAAGVWNPHVWVPTCWIGGGAGTCKMVVPH